MNEAEGTALIEELIELTVERPFDWSINISAPNPNRSGRVMMMRQWKKSNVTRPRNGTQRGAATVASDALLARRDWRTWLFHVLQMQLVRWLRPARVLDCSRSLYGPLPPGWDSPIPESSPLPQPVPVPQWRTEQREGRVVRVLEIELKGRRDQHKA